jgi:hypothetical protein
MSADGDTFFEHPSFTRNERRHAMTPTRGLILPIDEADGPLTRLAQLEADLGVEAIVRAMDAGAPVYDANGILFASWSSITLAKDLRRLTPENPEMAQT